MSDELEPFRLKAMDQGRLTGLSIGVHAIPDAFLLLHCGVGCKHKATTQLSTHDWGRSVVNREGWTEVGDAELIEGSADRLGPYLRSWQARVQPALIIVTSVTFLDLTGDDFRDEVSLAEETLPCPAIWVSAPGTSGDLHQGYLSLVLAVMSRMDWSRAPSRAGEVCIVGYLFDRYEGDQLGNLTVMRSLLRGLGLTLGPVLLSGAGWEALQQAPDSEHLVLLPLAHRRAKKIRRLTGREPLQTDLPLGSRASARWLRAVGAAAGTPASQVQAWIQRKQSQLDQRISWALPHLAGLRVALFAPLPEAQGISSLLIELGMQPVLIGVRGHSLGGEERLRDGLMRDGRELPAGCLVMEHPSLAWVQRELEARLQEGSLDAILGSAAELNLLRSLPASGPAALTEGPLVLEVSFPFKTWHVSGSHPTLGFAGVVCWVDRLLNAPRLAWPESRARR